MFDIGFWEIIIITTVALLVIGPEKLPQFARDAGKIVGKIQDFIYSTKKTIEKELDTKQVDHKLREEINFLDKLAKSAPDKVIDKKSKSEAKN